MDTKHLALPLVTQSCSCALEKAAPSAWWRSLRSSSSSPVLFLPWGAEQEEDPDPGTPGRSVWQAEASQSSQGTDTEVRFTVLTSWAVEVQQVNSLPASQEARSCSSFAPHLLCAVLPHLTLRAISSI